jgi:hypothetical protein
MSYAFAALMVLLAAAGGAFLFKLSNDNYGDAAGGYAICAIAWIAACFALAVKVIN